MSFWVIDTGGIDISLKGSLAEKVIQQVNAAIKEADILLFITDYKDGLLPVDIEVANFIRKHKGSKEMIFVINKVDHHECYTREVFPEFYELGIEDFIPISVLHGLNIDKLLERIKTVLLPFEGHEEKSVISIAIVGRPNVGKSSLLNTILGEERVIVDATPGTTRDAIDTFFTYQDRRFCFIDTAGMRKKRRVNTSYEMSGINITIKSIERADIALTVIDVTQNISSEEKKIIALLEEKGTAGIIVVNKCDLMPTLEKTEYKTYIHNELPFANFLPIVFTSALRRSGFRELFLKISQVADSYYRKVETPRLNKCIQSAYERCTPPSLSGKTLKIYYVVQTKTGPPTFLFFVNYLNLLTPSYRKYLYTKLKGCLNLYGTPIRIKTCKRSKGKTL